MVTVRSRRPELNPPNTHQWLIHELLSHQPLNRPVLLRMPSQLQSKLLECLPDHIQLMLLASHLRNLLLVHRARSKPRQQMLSLVNMAGMDRVGNLRCLRNHTKGSTSKPRPLKAHSKDISSRSLNHKPRRGLSLLHRTNFPHTTQQIRSSEMPTATTSNNTVNRAHRANRKALHLSRDHIAATVVHKPKELLSSPRAQLNSRSLDMPQLEKARRAARPLQIQVLRRSSQGLLRLPNLNQAIPNNPRPQTNRTVTLTIRAHTTLNT
jgi:hypothetical protein